MTRKDLRRASFRPRVESLELRDVPAAFVVDTTADTVAADGVETLREAIIDANAAGGDNTITFAAGLTAGGPATIELLSALPDLQANITITGPAANKLNVTRSSAGGTPNFRVFTIASMAKVSMAGLTISHGHSASDGGGILNSGTLTLTGVAVTGNNADGFGGGVENSNGTLIVVNSTISGNSADTGGGIDTFNLGTVTLSGVTISGNIATTTAGGINSDTSTTTIVGSTIANNHAGGTGGGILSGGGDVLLLNTIIVANTRGLSSVADNIQGTINTAKSRFNLIGAAGFGGLVNGQNGNRVGVPTPGLLPLAYNGGPVQTHALSATSPARDAGTSFLTTTAFALDASTTFFNVPDASYVAVGSVIRIDDEEMLVTTVFGSSISVIRGWNGTTATSHVEAASINAARDGRGLARTKDFAAIANAVGGDGTDIGAYEAQSRVLGVGMGGQPIVKLYEADTQVTKLSINPFGVADPTGIPFAVGDFNGDGIPDLAAGRAGIVRVFNGTNGIQMKEFQPFGAAYTGSVSLAAADLDGDGYADLAVGTGPGVLAKVRVFSGRDYSNTKEFFPWARFFGGLNVAADGGRIIVGTATQTSMVAVYDYAAQKVTRQLAPFIFGSGGVNVAAGDVNGDGVSDVIVSGATGTNRRVLLYRADNGLAEGQLMWAGPVGSGLRVAAADLNGDGIPDIVVASGRYAQPVISSFSGSTLLQTNSWQPFANSFLGGVLVG